MLDEVETFYIAETKVIDKTHCAAMIGEKSAFCNGWLFWHDVTMGRR